MLCMQCVYAVCVAVCRQQCDVVMTFHSISTSPTCLLRSLFQKYHSCLRLLSLIIAISWQSWMYLRSGLPCVCVCVCVSAVSVKGSTVWRKWPQQFSPCRRRIRAGNGVRSILRNAAARKISHWSHVQERTGERVFVGRLSFLSANWIVRKYSKISASESALSPWNFIISFIIVERGETSRFNS